MLLKAAAKRNVSLSVTEWPGGQPKSLTLQFSDLHVDKLQGGGRNIDLGKRQPPVALLGLPWGSLISLKSPSASTQVIADRAVFRDGKWLLPVPFGVEGRRVEDGPSEGRRFESVAYRDWMPEAPLRAWRSVAADRGIWPPMDESPKYTGSWSHCSGLLLPKQRAAGSDPGGLIATDVLAPDQLA